MSARRRKLITRESCDFAALTGQLIRLVTLSEGKRLEKLGTKLIVQF